ncbi:AraC family transcriptional regulator [Marinilongibacter aquaticus]|uniref:helix-turn-helix domain-containing protein n=1 Tax=Marinilongibacter aquaticus TaxID=2975157 RepID=UPI0021BD38E3|nr:AraC family transcriptional regulator [Marinilongibacter aquaticus]UBM59095.1 AraC family transcriptional regulator [Marinilongibacter aquaticus]
MSEEIKFYNKVSELYRDLGMPIAQDVEFTINNLLDIHQGQAYRSPVFRANYYSFVFIKKGHGRYTTDNKVFDYEDRTVYFTNPGHLKSFEFFSLGEAYLVTLSEAFLKKNVHRDVFEQFPFLLAETIPPQKFSEEGFKDLEVLYQQIKKEERGDSPNKYSIIGNLLVVILLKIKAQFWSEYKPLEEGSRSSQIVQGFKQQLEEHYRQLADGQEQVQYKAKDYARMLHIRPTYLSTVIKNKTGKSISQWISEKTIGQAKALLLHGNYSIKEVGYRLGFAETAHFSNFFKKNTGQTPSAFRDTASVL